MDKDQFLVAIKLLLNKAGMIISDDIAFEIFDKGIIIIFILIIIIIINYYKNKAKKSSINLEEFLKILLGNTIIIIFIIIILILFIDEIITFDNATNKIYFSSKYKIS